MPDCPVCGGTYPPGANFCPHGGHRLPDGEAGGGEDDPLLGAVVDGRYRLDEVLGRGGMGVVYGGAHVVIDKPVAVKVLRERYSEDARQSQRFLREARAASRIGHPNIVNITDFGRLEGGRIYLVMEYLRGATLAAEIAAHGPLSPRRCINLAVQICRGLHAAHEAGIVHRDLKPENLFIANPVTRPRTTGAGIHAQDVVKILDFGIAKITWNDAGRRITRVGSVFGTPQYMSPEQAAGRDTDHRADIYALGCILYEMLTGELPFVADTFGDTLTKHLTEEAAGPGSVRPELRVPDPLEAVVLRALRKDPDERFEDVEDVAAELERCYQELEQGPVRRVVEPVAGGEGAPLAVVERSEGGAPAPAGSVPRRRWPLLVVVGATLVVAGTIGGVYLLGDGPAGTPPAPALEPAADAALPALGPDVGVPGREVGDAEAAAGSRRAAGRRAGPTRTQARPRRAGGPRRVATPDRAPGRDRVATPDRAPGRDRAPMRRPRPDAGPQRRGAPALDAAPARAPDAAPRKTGPGGTLDDLRDPF